MPSPDAAVLRASPNVPLMNNPCLQWDMESSWAFPTRCSDALPSCCCLQWDMESSLAFPTRLMSYAEHALRVRHVASSMDAR